MYNGRLHYRSEFATMVFKALIVVMLILIVGSLFSALFYMYKDQGKNKRTVKALTFRIGLSIALFVMVMAAFYFGLIPGGNQFK